MERHPFVELCEAADLDPDAVALRFPERPYQAAAWVADRWRTQHPSETEPGLLQIAGLAEDYVRSAA